MITTYTALDWKRARHTVTLSGKVIESQPKHNLYLCRCKGVYSVHYGLLLSYFVRLSDAAQEYESCQDHAKGC